MCIDYRQLNSLTVVKNANYGRLPCMMQSFDQRSIINLDTRMHEAYIPKTAFRTHSCHYELTVMPTKAPATFDGMIFESSNSRQLYFRSFANNYFRRLETKNQMNVAGPTRREVKKEKADNSSYFSSVYGLGYYFFNYFGLSTSVLVRILVQVVGWNSRGRRQFTPQIKVVEVA